MIRSTAPMTAATHTRRAPAAHAPVLGAPRVLFVVIFAAASRWY
jgi:hypothetical protein